MVADIVGGFLKILRTVYGSLGSLGPRMVADVVGWFLKILRTVYGC